MYTRGKKQKNNFHYDYLLENCLPIQNLFLGMERMMLIEGVATYHNFSESKKYPLVVQTHGGPRSSDKFGF